MRASRILALAAAAWSLGAACGITDDEGPKDRDPITISGTVHATVQIVNNVAVYGATVAGATVSTSLDARTATTDASGRFSLTTETLKHEGDCTNWTLMASAPGHPTFSVTGAWGDEDFDIQIGLSGPRPVVQPCT